MNTYPKIENTNTPQYARISNSFVPTNDKSKCNPFGADNNFGNYFQQCLDEATND